MELYGFIADIDGFAREEGSAGTEGSDGTDGCSGATLVGSCGEAAIEVAATPRSQGFGGEAIVDEGGGGGRRVIAVSVEGAAECRLIR